MIDCTPCARCQVPAAVHYGFRGCAGFVPPLPGPVARLRDRAVRAGLALVARLYRYPEG